MPTFDHESFLQHLGVRWAKLPLEDVNEDFVDLRGEVDRLPEPDEVERAFSALGFACKESRRADVLEYLGQRGVEKLTCWVGGLRRSRSDSRLHFEWRSNRWPLVAGRAVDWGGRTWPAFFDEARTYHRSREMLMLSGKVPGAAFDPLLERYRAWAAETGFEPVEPYEPDIAGPLCVRDGEFEMTLEDRLDGTVMLVASRAG